VFFDTIIQINIVILHAKRKKMKQKPIRLFSRATIALLMMLLTATTASGNAFGGDILGGSGSGRSRECDWDDEW
jgi:hypothetical protein